MELGPPVVSKPFLVGTGTTRPSDEGSEALIIEILGANVLQAPDYDQAAKDGHRAAVPATATVPRVRAGRSTHPVLIDLSAWRNARR